MSGVINACYEPAVRKMISKTRDFKNGKFTQVSSVQLVNLPFNGENGVDGTTLAEEHTQFLDTLIAKSRDAGFHIIIKAIHGYASSIGDTSHNSGLSKLRAEHVYSYLDDKIIEHSIQASFMLPEQSNVKGKGEVSSGFYPYEESDDPLQRRVEIIYTLDFDVSRIPQSYENLCKSDMWTIGFDISTSNTQSADSDSLPSLRKLKNYIVGGEIGFGSIKQLNPEKSRTGMDCGHKGKSPNKYNEKKFVSLSLQFGFEPKLLKTIEKKIESGLSTVDDLGKVLSQFILGQGFNAGTIASIPNNGGFATNGQYSLEEMGNALICMATVSAGASVMGAGVSCVVLLIPLITEVDDETHMEFEMVGTVLGEAGVGSTQIQPGAKFAISFGTLVFFG